MVSGGALLALVLLGACHLQYAAAMRPRVNTTCCPATRAYLEHPKPVTALMSYPGSGNTWTRHIIETLTGHHTTSVYCDRSLVPVFRAECDSFHNFNRSIVVKTHKLANCSRWKKAVVILRDPLHSIRSEYQRIRTSSHTGFLTAEGWNWQNWYKVSSKLCRNWAEQFAAVFGVPGGRRGCADDSQYKVFFYEDLKTASGKLNPYFLDELLNWFGIDKADSFYDCALKYNEGAYARHLPADSPAAKVLTDPETLERFEAAGCMPAFRRYNSTLPHLQQPAEVLAT